MRRLRRQSQGAVLRLGDNAGPQWRSQVAGEASLWVPGLGTADGDSPEGAELQRAWLPCSLVAGLFPAQPRKPDPPSQWHPPESPFRTRKVAPTHALAGGSRFPKEKTPCFAPLLVMEPATGCPCPDVHVSPGLPESGLAGTRGPALAFGREGSHWRHGLPCVSKPRPAAHSRQRRLLSSPPPPIAVGGSAEGHGAAVLA